MFYHEGRKCNYILWLHFLNEWLFVFAFFALFKVGEVVILSSVSPHLSVGARTDTKQRKLSRRQSAAIVTGRPEFEFKYAREVLCQLQVELQYFFFYFFKTYFLEFLLLTALFYYQNTCDFNIFMLFKYFHVILMFRYLIKKMCFFFLLQATVPPEVCYWHF